MSVVSQPKWEVTVILLREIYGKVISLGDFKILDVWPAEMLNQP